MGSLLAGTKTNKIKGIVFDLDDTLYPQESYKRSGFKAVAQWMSAHYDFSVSTIMAELESIMQQKGPSYPCMFNDLTDRLKMDKCTVSQMVQVFIDHVPIIRCYPGVHAMLARLRERYKLGLLTDGRFIVQQRKIRALNLETEFDEILCSDMLGLEKPANELFEFFERKFDMAGQSLMYVGDNPEKDFYGANFRSWSTVCVMTPQNQNADCEGVHKSSHKIYSIDYLDKLLKSYNLF